MRRLGSTAAILALGIAIGCGGERRERRSWRVEVRRSRAEVPARATGAAGPIAPVGPAAAIARRDLGPLPPELAGPRWPRSARIEREIEAADLAALQRGLDRAGTRVRVVGRIAGEAIVHASDIEVLIAPEARIERVVVEAGVHRVRVAGGAVGSVELAPPARFGDDGRARWDDALFVDDVVLEDLRVEARDTGLVIRGRRVAVLGCQVEAERYALWAGDTGPLDGEDLIVAGCRLRSAGPESTLRMHDVVRSVVVDDVLENGAKHNYRVHGRSDLAFAARNVLVRTGLMLGTQPGDAVGTVFFVGNVLHHQAPSLLEIEPRSIRRLVYRGNVAYTDVWDSCFPFPQVAQGWEVEDNRREPFRPWSGGPIAPR